MLCRTLTVSLVCGLLVGAYVGCGSGDDSGGLSGIGSYHPSPGAASGSSSGAATTPGNSSSSSGGSSSSSGGVDASAPVEAAPPPLTLSVALSQFAACMSYAAFTEQNAQGHAAADVAKTMVTVDGNAAGDCNSCHNTGDEGFWASYGLVMGQDMSQVMFQETGVFPYITKWVTGTVDGSGNFKDLAPSNAIADKSMLAADCVDAGGPCHPQFQLDPGQLAAINSFVTSTLTEWHTGTCNPSMTLDAGTDAGTD